jgi:hypothetical protein
MEHLATISEAAELRMTNATWPMLQRLLYTSFEFSSLPSRGVGCVGCAPSSEPVGGCKNPTRLLPRVQQRIRTSAAHAATFNARRATRTLLRAGAIVWTLTCASMCRGLFSAVLPVVLPGATELRIDIDQQTLCGHKSYFGESGATDAFEGLMEVGALKATHAWHTLVACHAWHSLAARHVS